MSNVPYRHLATYYDLLFTDVRWRGVAHNQILRKHLKNVSSVCDLACGTGSSAVGWAQEGHKVYAVDLSPAMCRLTRKKARMFNVPVTVIEDDMRRFRLPERVDLVTCEYDALNHVPKRDDLFSVAKSVARALHSGGHFYFDVNMRLAFEKVWPLTWWLEKPGVVMVMRGGYDPTSDPDRASVDVEFFIAKGPHWKRYHEQVDEVCWSDQEIRDTLQSAGFDEIRAWDAARFIKDSPYIRRGHRTFYLARKR